MANYGVHFFFLLQQFLKKFILMLSELGFLLL